ncbi:G-protein coupled receptor dmsr-1-like [Anthonomus grandis grandis]|uniref:G-protein coupled receptor dmsr-1-like n=1 Tax=Anthonomus grandis grandis TaxID=2921223 RepID=UPI0021653C6E|nr:G-protein coupled receptor dmsr-1-like [Anthonomus grandis grandis]XP_050292898.1 G-protein coupled receptor dmsr-1-like [Anthonomus grandis grandis]XP_050292899.1 G-protein coupled receptor dmsr-1-like [Anthonomus grandis grandis]
MTDAFNPTPTMRNYTYCDLEDFKRNYKENVHGYLSLTVCIFGSIANIFNICVLRTKQMRSPTNYILTGLATADLLVMLQYIPFTIHRNLAPSPLHYNHFNYPWAIFYKFHSLFTLVLHFISCVLTIILAIWRYVYVSQLHASKICSDQKKTLIVIVISYIMCPLLCFPMFSTLEIKEYQQTCDRDGLIVLMKDRIKYDKYLLKNETIFLLYPNDPLQVSVWVYSLVLKLVPCLFLSVLSYLIISALIETRRRRLRLLNSCNPLEEFTKHRKSNSVQLFKDTQADRTTKMLLAVLFLFLLTEFPQGILGQISAIYGNVFLQECYSALGEVMDIMALINSSITFILYCTMSRQFRVTFQEMFQIEKITRWMALKRSSSKVTQEENGVETKMSLV